MDDQSKLSKNRFVLAAILAIGLFGMSIIMLAAVLVFITKYGDRCHVMHCSPASWEKIRDMALAEIGNDFRIESISAEPSYRRNSYTENGPAFIDVRVSYVSLNKDSQCIDEHNTCYPMKSLEFDDQNLIKRIYSGSSWSNEVPTQESQAILKRVTVGPRDVIHTTWALAKEKSSLPADNADVMAFLFLDGKKRGWECESIWIVTYYYETTILTFQINARTGQIVSEKSR